MNILFLDYLSYSQHKVFNSIHIDSLLRLGHRLSLIGKKDQFNDYIGKDNIEIKTIPSSSSKFGFNSIIDDMKNLYWIKNNIIFKNYEIIIIPTYDILSLSLFRITGRVIIINHNNISLFTESKIGKLRLFLTKHLPLNYTQICLNELMTKTMKRLLPLHMICHVPHGLCIPSSYLVKPEFIKEKENYVFCPINRNFDYTELSEILSSQQLHDCLKELNLNLYIKDIVTIKNNFEKIKIIKKSLDKSEYDYLINNSNAILLPYGKSFGKRCSGILFEGISRNKHIISSDTEAIRAYEGLASISYYRNIEELCKCLKECSNNIKVDNNLSIFNPDNYWNQII